MWVTHFRVSPWCWCCPRCCLGGSSGNDPWPQITPVAAVRRPSSHQTATSHRGNPFSRGIIRKPELYFLWRCQNAEHSVCGAWWDGSKALRTKFSYNLSDRSTNMAFLLKNWVHLKTGVSFHGHRVFVKGPQLVKSVYSLFVFEDINFANIWLRV